MMLRVPLNVQLPFSSAQRVHVTSVVLVGVGVGVVVVELVVVVRRYRSASTEGSVVDTA